jgi:hypothetical protein
VAQSFIQYTPRKEASELRGYFMRHKVGVDIGFSWDEHDARFPADQWERIPAVAEQPALDTEAAITDFEMRVMHDFLQWNRAQPKPLVEVTKEYGIARKVLQLAKLAGSDVARGLVANANLLDEARKTIGCLLGALMGVKYVESSRAAGQQVLAKLDAALEEAPVPLSTPSPKDVQ